MTTSDFTTSLTVEKTAREVFNAISNVRGWWSKDIEGETSTIDGEFIFQVKGVHYSRQKVIEVIPDKKIIWEVIESHMTFISNASEWTGTRIIFEIVEQHDKTKLVFTHAGLIPTSECYDACSPAWTQYIQHSLMNLIANGKGDPNLEGRRIEAIKA